jgi:xanthine dehydrogenase accessory factor
MIGSKSKVKAIFDQLISEGFPEKAVQRVDSPIGLPIGSQTPAEIAVSIAAKIVQVRNSK